MKTNINKVISTPKLFKYNSKRKLKIISPSKITTNFKSNIQTNMKTNTPKQKVKNASNINPFQVKSIFSRHNKTLGNKKVVTSINKNIGPKHVKTKKESQPDINEFLLTDESDYKIKMEEFDVEYLSKLFKFSNFKKTIILDNKGNNDLNSEQKKLINNYLQKKAELENNIKKSKINSIKVEKYNHNNILLKQKKAHLNQINKSLQIKLNIKFGQKYNNIFQSSRNRKKNMQKPILTTKPSNKKLKNFFELNTIKEEKINNNNKNNDDKENNSLFENCTNRSFDYSFIESSLAEDFLQAFEKAKAKK